jgi:DNA polymerase III alpha subunit
MTQELAQIQRLVDRFRRTCPEDPKYQNRLAEEFEIILKLRFVDYFIQICDVLELTRDIPHMTRGSAGSSLVCYLLGITDVDPIHWNIPVARFLNPTRDDLPDVDIDFPHHKQEEVMNRIFKKWPGKTARISNYVTYQPKSAKREAAKRLGVTGNLPRNFTYKSLGVDEKEAKRIENKLLGKKRCISKHCGGIIVFQRKLPKSLISENNQILLDKHEVEDLEHLKIDILANRGLSQLTEIDQTPLTDYPEEDEATSELLCRGDVLGVTQAESPAMRRLFRAIQPRSKSDCVFATALIRPVAISGRKKASMFQDWSREKISDAIVYEDDAIIRIAEVLDCDHYEADMYRRAFAKRNEEKIMEFCNKMGNHPRKAEIVTMLESLSGFGLCRAHAVNLGRLIWALAYQKAHNKKKFWQACINNCQGSYRRWVYKTEANRAGLTPVTPSKSDHFDDPVYQFKKYGWWSHKDFLPRCYVMSTYLNKIEFAGLIANGRVFRGDRGKYITFLTVGVGNGEYIDLHIHKALPYRDSDIVWGQGEVKTKNGSHYVDVHQIQSYPAKQYYA